jgi:hypothetical protein
MMLGASNFEEPYEEGRVDVHPLEVIVHDDWDPETDRFNDDIAILMMEFRVHSSDFIQPICMWKFQTDPYLNTGIVVGWRTNDDDPIGEILKVPILKNKDNCFEGKNQMAALGVEKSFCAGKPGNTVCRGNSGNGLIIKIGEKFFLKGIFSICYTKTFAVFTNIIKYLSWIKNPKGIEETCGIMSSSAGLVQGGDKSKRNQFPWIVAISKKVNGGLETTEGTDEWNHYGSGSLISDEHIIAKGSSVAYVGKESSNLVVARNNEIKLYFGTSEFNSTNEHGSDFIDGANGIDKILLHPEARAYDLDSNVTTIGNLAVIFLKKLMKFSEFISPVCLWKFDIKISNQAGHLVYGVGYGLKVNEESFTGVRRHVAMTISNDSICGENYEEFIVKAPRTEYFCAKGNNYPYDYDFPLYMKTDERWFLRGMLELMNKGHNVVLYENQSKKYVEWITSVTQP